ncbi:DUF5403 family protein [Paractinoplanes rishiriensis]|uniref:Uncharacterized protein n=1 Tax=Paractinoplanes rishiriensis TaxID=1050105 RepID=A0A919K9H7_9ACTN|nr:DUF5403 family protein [Actinoplanes rishiriensis]GIF02225.1 hypothetical protein Ari01nite_96890 [Actinoplanes rishiriensis]
MAEIYRSTNRRLAKNAEVQAELERRAFEVAARAEVELIRHRQDGNAEIDIEHGRIDWYVILSDERGQKAALSIEYGRVGYTDPETGESWGAMEGLFILHRAAHLSPKSRAKIRVPLPRRRKRGRR